MRTEDPVSDFGIEVREAPATAGGRAVEVSRFTDKTGTDWLVDRFELAPNGGPLSRVDVLVFDDSLVGSPFELLTGPEKIPTGPGRKVVALIRYTPGLELEIQTITAPRPKTVPPGADGHELELVACLTERIEDGSALLADLAEAGLIVRLEVFRLAAPLGTLELVGGRFRWIEEEDR